MGIEKEPITFSIEKLSRLRELGVIGVINLEPTGNSSSSVTPIDYSPLGVQNSTHEVSNT